MATSWSRPTWARPPMPEYSPSEFSDDHHVDVFRLLTGERTRHAGKELHRSEIDVEIEALANRQEHSPERDVIGYLRRTDGTEVDGVKRSELPQGIVGHH